MCLDKVKNVEVRGLKIEDWRCLDSLCLNLQTLTHDITVISWVRVEVLALCEHWYYPELGLEDSDKDFPEIFNLQTSNLKLFNFI